MSFNYLKWISHYNLEIFTWYNDSNKLWGKRENMIINKRIRLGMCLLIVFIISLFANITNLEIAMNSFNIILPFLFGLILGIYIVSLLISKLFCHYKNTTYNIILGIFISTIISLTYQTLTKLSTTHELIIGIPLLLVGYTLGKAFDR